MHERTQRAVARLLFVLACALPTSITLLLIVITFTPWFADYRRAGLERELSQRLGLTVLIDTLEHPTPATVRLNGVRLLEPETLAEVARIRVVTWVRTDDKTALRLSQPELQSAMLPYSWRVIHDRFLCQPKLTVAPVRVAADDLTIHSKTGAVTLRDVDAWLRPEADRVEAMIQCVPASRQDQSPVHVSVVRDRSSALPSTDWTMNTGNVPLNCSAIADYLPAMAMLGPDATFTGTMRWKIRDAAWSIDLGGSRFEHVDLAMATQGIPHRLVGNAGIQLESCQWEKGVSLNLSGALIAEQGFISQSLLQALASHVDFKLASDVDLEAKDIPFDAMALRFDFFGPEMRLEGVCHRQRGQEYLPQGTAIVSGGSAVAACSPTAQRRSWVELVHAFWPDQIEKLPFSSQTAWLLPLLPAPPPATNYRELLGNGPPRITAAGEPSGSGAIRQP